MLTDETKEKADAFLDAAVDVSDSATAAAKAAKKRKKERDDKRKKLKHGVTVALNGLEDEDKDDDHVIAQNSLEPDDTPAALRPADDPFVPDPAVVSHDPAPADPPTAVTPVVIAAEPAQIPPNHVPWYKRILSGGARKKIGILILVLIAIFIGTFIGWNWLSEHALGDQKFAQNNVLAVAIAAVVTLGAGFILWPEDETES